MLLAEAEKVLRSGRFAGGSAVAAFEESFARYCDVQACAGVSSGTDALRFAFMAVGVKPGDEMITVPQTFIATTEAITQAGGAISFVDIHPGTHTMDPALIEDAITPRTVGIVPVHLYGRPADMDPILDIANRHNLWVVEDAAQAHGARYKGRRVGSLGHAACFSFYPGKNLGACGEAGAVVSNDKELIERIKVIRDHGQVSKYRHVMEGYNGRLDALQAAFLSVKLTHLDRWTANRRQVAAWYDELLRDIEVVEPPREPEYAESVFHLYAPQAERRDELAEALGKAQIGVGKHYPTPLHLQDAYRAMGYRAGAFPAAERVAARTLSLPMYPELTRELVERVVATIGKFQMGNGCSA